MLALQITGGGLVNIITVASVALIISLIGVAVQYRRRPRTEPEDTTLLDYTGLISWSFIVVAAAISLVLKLAKL